MSLNKDLRYKYKVRMYGVKGNIPAGTVDRIIYKLDTEQWLSGAHVILKNHADDDCLDFNIVDKDFAYVGVLYPNTPTEAGIPGVEGLTWQQVTPNGVHLDDFGKCYQVCTDRQDQGKESPGYWAKIPINLYIEIKYTSTGNTDVLVKVNLHLHEEK